LAESAVVAVRGPELDARDHVAECVCVCTVLDKAPAEPGAKDLGAGRSGGCGDRAGESPGSARKRDEDGTQPPDAEDA
jgi:hypothetical protein